MKFAHSLVFNSVPEWTSHYLNYEALKAAIYRFEKQQLAPPPTEYTDLERGADSPLLGNGNGNGASANRASNDKLFTRLLDQELNKITEFYVAKERELLGDLALLQADVDRIEDETSHLSGQGMTSGASDSEDDRQDDDEEGDEGVAAKTSKMLKGAIEQVFSNPRNYDAANREARKARRKRASSFSRSIEGLSGGEGSGGRRRARALSNASATSGDLLGIDDIQEEEQAQNGGAHSAEFGRRAVRKIGSKSFGTPSRKRDSSRFTTGSIANEDDDDGVFGGTSDWAIDTRIMYKRRIAALFTALSELKQYVDLNYTGLSKVLKKYDKITNSKLRSKYMSEVVDLTFPFEAVTQERLSSAIKVLVPLYANLATGGDIDQATKQLNAHLREHVVWERNTVWREMIGLERRGWGAGTGAPKRAATAMPIIKGDETKSAEGVASRSWLPAWLNTQVVGGSFAVLLFLTLLNLELFDRVEEGNCLALLAFVTIFWALEIVPLFVTALMVPFLVVVLRVIRSTDGEDRRLTASESTKYIFGQMFSPTIMLLLGGFTLAAALSKQNIDKVLATKVLSLAGTKPKYVLLAYMLVACFASMWISNVAAPVLCYSLIQPILRTLPQKSPFSKALILGIALASNIGGLASPISSPQNLIALEYMNPQVSWLGIIAIIPIVLFYGSGVLRKADFDHSPWSIVILAMGGISLGKSVLSSGLLDDLDQVVEDLVLGLDIWPILALFSVIVLVIATLISHTIAAVLVVPIAARIGAAMETPHPTLLILATAFICSAGMGLPISGFPNLQAINVEDDLGDRYLEPRDFFTRGIPASVVATTVIITLGYGIMRALGV
ncbi:BZ3500_MvSof-1268-A1-R1_Chr2-3g05407 [Microbotryum saponariae]|uniref:BZ3500_MvSof-1268-A1-R1_Chr2-3g05407 protein n=1 Tax=Microbotryum saponariae TaxID=289078 RepID=A0A2X0N836_9BASI|nr:BZ3500_MvSof-1268-A1-R1_Chr2-3g05407 [Microbotryum saponariae]SDA01386.1 BZ3501_MvSof-1269-A2-R1_Chr2-2g05080 [Microbotryum saponariae]